MTGPTKKKRKKPTKPVRGEAPAAARPAADERPRPFDWRDRGDLVRLGIVVGIALALRVVFFYLNQRNNPVFEFPIMDALYHHDWANDILAGGTWASDDTYFRGPLYPYFLAAIYKLTGSSIAAAVFVQHLVGALGAGVFFLLAREYFSPRVALTAGVVGALYWPFVYFEGDLLIVSSIIFLNSLCFLLFAMAARKHSVALYAAAGLVLGLSAIARPSILIFFPAVPLFIYLTSRKRPEGTAGWVKRFVLAGAATAIVIAPVMVRNYVVGQAVVPVAASGGVNFYIGNNPASDGSTAIVPGTRADWWGGFEDAVAIAENDTGRKLRLAEVSSYYFGRGMEFIAERPGEAWPLMFKKLRMFWAGPERANNKFIYFFWNLAGMKYVPLPGFWLVAPLALLGAVLLWRRRGELSMLYLFVLLYMIGVVIFFVNARFRLPVVPVLILFASYAAFHVAGAFRRKSFDLVRAILILAAAAFIVNSDFFWLREIRAYSNAFSHNTLGNAYIKMGLKESALDQYSRADQLNRETPTPAYQLIARDVNYNLGVLLWEKGLCSRAIDALERVGGTDSFAVTAMDHLADCYLKRNQVDKAAEVYQRLLRIDPNDVRAVTGLARCQAAAGNLQEAERMLSSVVDPLQQVYPPAYIALAQVQTALGKFDEAIESYTNISRYAGYERNALMALAEVYTQRGDVEAALRTLETARNYFPPGDPTFQDLYNRIRSLR